MVRLTGFRFLCLIIKIQLTLLQQSSQIPQRIIIPNCTYLAHSGNLVQPCNGQTNWFQISMPNNKDSAHVIATV